MDLSQKLNQLKNF